MSDEGTHDTIDALMAENRTFPPSEEFKGNALVAGTFLYDEAAEDAAMRRVASSKCV